MNKDIFYCKSCGGFVNYDRSARLLTNPPKYKGCCKDCKETSYEFCYKVDKGLKAKEGA